MALTVYTTFKHVWTLLGRDENNTLLSDFYRPKPGKKNISFAHCSYVMKVTHE